MLSTVGEAAQFIDANFSAPRSGDVDWKLAAISLEKAVSTDDFVLYAHATKAVGALLRPNTCSMRLEAMLAGYRPRPARPSARARWSGGECQRAKCSLAPKNCRLPEELAG